MTAFLPLGVAMSRNKRMSQRRPRRAGDRSKAPAPSLAQVCEHPADYLDKLDIGALNLMCAGGLPGA